MHWSSCQTVIHCHMVISMEFQMPRIYSGAPYATQDGAISCTNAVILDSWTPVLLLHFLNHGMNSLICWQRKTKRTLMRRQSNVSSGLEHTLMTRRLYQPQVL